MATRSRTTFKKRQKELARIEKQRDKAARRVQRKQLAAAGGGEGEQTDEELIAMAMMSPEELEAANSEDSDSGDPEDADSPKGPQGAPPAGSE